MAEQCTVVLWQPGDLNGWTYGWVDVVPPQGLDLPRGPASSDKGPDGDSFVVAPNRPTLSPRLDSAARYEMPQLQPIWPPAQTSWLPPGEDESPARAATVKPAAAYAFGRCHVSGLIWNCRPGPGQRRGHEADWPVGPGAAAQRWPAGRDPINTGHVLDEAAMQGGGNRPPTRARLSEHVVPRPHASARSHDMCMADMARKQSRSSAQDGEDS
jgi:hypothetical protein